jgi:hypothetical protein
VSAPDDPIRRLVELLGDDAQGVGASNFDCFMRVRLSTDPAYQHDVWGRTFQAAIPGVMYSANDAGNWYSSPHAAIDAALLFFAELNAESYERRARQWRDLLEMFRMRIEQRDADRFVQVTP